MPSGSSLYHEMYMVAARVAVTSCYVIFRKASLSFLCVFASSPCNTVSQKHISKEGQTKRRRLHWLHRRASKIFTWMVARCSRNSSMWRFALPVHLSTAFRFRSFGMAVPAEGKTPQELSEDSDGLNLVTHLSNPRNTRGLECLAKSRTTPCKPGKYSHVRWSSCC